MILGFSDVLFEPRNSVWVCAPSSYRLSFSNRDKDRGFLATAEIAAEKAASLEERLKPPQTENDTITTKLSCEYSMLRIALVRQ